ncbi:MAG: hypothetical protein DSY43_02840 [Gammaproteobacteria bacterium]|nr:MAG: hypothetical protein DSY43_02840 [Gammaproteobacteria bacterium]
MDFEKIELLYLTIPIALLWFFIHNRSGNIEDLFAPDVLEKISFNKHKISIKTRLRFLLLAIVLILIALSRPTLEAGEVKIKKYSSDLIVAIDMSKSMLANDVYPNRFELAKNKLSTSLDKISEKRIAILGFANRAFLVSPLTDDFSSLKFLIKNLRLDAINLKGTNVLNLLQSADDLLGEASNKQLLLLTDGGDKSDFSKEISYANAHNLTIFVFDIATRSGSTIKDKKGILKDEGGNIVIVKSNPNIKKLATQTQGRYLKYSLNNNDLTDFINSFKSYASSKDIKVIQKQHLFYYPLAFALFLLFFAFFSLPKNP